MLVSMLHHVEDPAAALAEARRVLRPGGRLALMVFTREDTAESWLSDYFPSTRAWMFETHSTRAELLALLPGARQIAVVFRDLRRRVAGGAVGVSGEAARSGLAPPDELLRAARTRPS